MRDPCIVWFRHDLRLDDNPALHISAPIIPCFIWSPEEEGKFPPGGASKWWLYHSLLSLQVELESRGLKLTIRAGNSLEELRLLSRETGAKIIHWNRRYEPSAIKRDEKIKSSLRDDGLTAKSFNASLIVEPWDLLNKQGKPYQVYTPFSKSFFSREIPKPKSVPKSLEGPANYPKSLKLDDLELLPKKDWADGFSDYWSPGSKGANSNLKTFLKREVFEYSDGRNIPSTPGTSRLSPHLHFGEISPRRIWHAAHGKLDKGEGVKVYLKEIIWREFAYHLLFHFPKTPEQPLREEFKKFPWKKNKRLLTLWQKGQTNCPIVDAGLRELWATGWMHNRVRMIVGSYLVKHMLQPWQQGAGWFWDTLVDADLASNTLGWQWVAGCGADAAPYFRVFNPVLQGERFDPQGVYVKKWVPELKNVPTKLIHKPWEYNLPKPIVDIQEGRQRALLAYESFKSANA